MQADEKVPKKSKIVYLSMENLAKFNGEAAGPAHSSKKSKRDSKVKNKLQARVRKTLFKPSENKSTASDYGSIS